MDKGHILDEALLNGPVNVQFIRRLQDTLAGVIRPYMERRAPGSAASAAGDRRPPYALELAAWWLENDMPYPVEDMARYYERLISPAAWQAILPQGSAAAGHASPEGR
jgi:hypothetical protein